MFHIEYQSLALKCPYCPNIIKIEIGKVPGGVNDSGGWIIKCGNCNSLFPYSVINPRDYSNILSGGITHDYWEEDVEDKATFLKRKQIEDKIVEDLIYNIDDDIEPIKFNLNSEPIYISKTGDNLEELAYSKLDSFFKKNNKTRKNKIEEHYKKYYNYYLKGRNGDPKFMYIILDFKDLHKEEHIALFYCNFSGKGELPQEINNYLLGEVTNRKEHDWLINGIYTRDECKNILDKFLIRWRGMFSFSIIVVPFVGYQNQKLEKREKIWNWLKKYTSENNVLFYTRSVAIKLLESSRKANNIPVDVLKEFEITEAGIDKAKINNFFHSKFYIGLNEHFSEILKGSYNIHENNYLENFDFQSIDSNYLSERYLNPIGIDSSTMKFSNKDAFYIDLRKDKSNIEFNFKNGIELFNKIKI